MAELQLGGKPAFEGGEALLLESRRGCAQRGRVGCPVERRTTPERKGFDQLRECLLRRPTVDAADHLLEQQGIDPLLGDAEAVPAPARLDRVGAERPPQLRDVDMERVTCLVRCLLLPDPVDQVGARDALAGAEREHAQHREPLCAAHIDSPPTAMSAHVPEQPHAERIRCHVASARTVIEPRPKSYGGAT